MFDHGFQILFFDWFQEYYLEPKQINVINQCFKWQIGDGQIIESNHPPLTQSKQVYKGTEIILNPYKATTENENDGIRKVIEQNNFTNQHLHTIGKQLDRIEVVLDNKT